MSDGLRSAIVGKACEIYVNAFDHGHSPVGVFTSGQHYPRRKQLKLCVADFGIGIPDNVRGYLKDSTKTGAETMQWAFQRGNTTKLRVGSTPEAAPSKPEMIVARGLGLDLLREFVALNNGRLEIFSHDGEAVVDRTQSFTSRSTIFPGTLVNITFSCDESFYLLASEASGKPLFS